ncbi:MAG: MBOAT family protein [Ignavibacteriaceae bacterium]|nr:MBOAT family protein [Ignavibacteriaceae bacterium]
MEAIELLKYNQGNPLLFNSVLFFFLFTVLYILFTAFAKNIKARNAILLIFSLYFYYKISGEYIGLLIAVGFIDFFVGKYLVKESSLTKRRILLAISVMANVGILIYFKYTFFIVNQFGLQSSQFFSYFTREILTPVGISYYIFKSLGYILSIYREELEEAETNIVNYLLYVSFFPTIVAGPITKAANLLPQFRSATNITRENVSKGLFLLITGILKKVLIADFIALNFVDRVFENPDLFTSFECLIAGYGAFLQLYFDFSGYTDIVRGMAYLLGFELEENFRKPFLANSVSEFWRRWHITLYTFLSENIFNPLSFSLRRIGIIGIYFSILVTFLISGIWHGANLTFVVWGLIHGLCIVFDTMFRNTRKKLVAKVNERYFKWFEILVTFHVIAFSFIIFKAPSLESAETFIYKLFSGIKIVHIEKWMEYYMIPFLVMVIGLLLAFLPERFYKSLYVKFAAIHWSLKASAFALVIIFVYQVLGTSTLPFVYIEF